MPDATTLHWVTQAGGFGLLGLVLWYIGRHVVPFVMAEFQRRDSQFLAALDRRDQSAERTAGLVAGKLDRLTEQVGAVAAEVRDLRHDFDAHIDGGPKHDFDAHIDGGPKHV